MRSLIFVTFLIAAACGENDASYAQVGGPVRTGPPNTQFQPAFVGQTRAPEARSDVQLRVEQVARLEHPWAIAFLPDGRALVTEREGRLRIVSANGAVSQPVAGLPPVDARGQGGLLDVAIGPSFAEDRLIYWSFSELRGGGRNSTSVARGRLSEDGARVSDVAVIFRQEPPWRSQGHFGSRIVFDREGRLFVTMGDRQGEDSRPLAQDLSSTIGKIARINADGSIPSDNPFVGREGVRAEIWAVGVRNVQGADLHPDTGELWEVEHGPRGGDELNIVRAGRNYGWPLITYGEEYSGAAITDNPVREGLEQPVYYWDPVIAPGDMDFYRGDLFPWRGDVLIAGLSTEAIVRLRLDGERVVGEERFELGHGRIRDLTEAPDGALWVITDEDDGEVLRVTPQ
ncbi:MAG: PQQ-dependent sugar dehydrogenase [Hyphomonadaceae bacterium]|nr:PQQ-dependent sugar dehydrogenase [Hyphomonadaceae bacterium]